MKTKQFTLLVTGGLLGLALALLVLLAAPTHAAPDAVLTVCPAGPPDCMYSVIQDAVDAANDGDVIKVATGVYTGVQGRPSPPGYNGPAVITQVVYISKTVALRGGYTAPGFADPPDPDANPTTLDAERLGRVLVIAGYISPTIEGLHITDGDAFGLGGSSSGDDGGGGLFAVNASLTISNSQVLHSFARSGGGMYMYQCNDVYISGTLVANNKAINNGTLYSMGGGLYMGQSTRITFSGNSFVSNMVTDAGGGLSLSETSYVIFQENVISNNQAINSGGGGLSMWDSDPITLTNSTIISNTTGDRGGGVYIRGIV
jgi:parallel beta-helix repeat protein